MDDAAVEPIETPWSVEVRRLILWVVVSAAVAVAVQLVVRFAVEQMLGDQVPATGDEAVKRANIVAVFGWSLVAFSALGTAYRMFRGARQDLALEGRIRWWGSFWISIVGYGVAGVLCWVWVFTDGLSTF